ncbi:MAG: T9SS type A sorting domain-containing protein [Vicingaceae bacterium]
MKTQLTLAALALFVSAQAQNDTKDDKVEHKVETIKIVDGDTVLHQFTRTKGNALHTESISRGGRNITRVKQVSYDEDYREDNSDNSGIDEELMDLDIYMTMDPSHKRMMLHRINMADPDMAAIIEELGEDENLVIEFEDGRRVMKIMKIEIDDDDLKEVKTIEMGPGHHKRERSVRPEGNSSSGIKAYPNPTKDELNLEFEVLKGDAKVKVMDIDGKILFEQTFKDAGKYNERIKLKETKQKLLIVELKESGRVERIKIIAD